MNNLMNLKAALPVLIILTLPGCEVFDDGIDYSEIRISSVTGYVPKIECRGNKISAIGDRQFIYDSNGRLSGLRTHYYSILVSDINDGEPDTIVYEYLTKYSYSRSGNRIIFTVDTSLTSRNGELLKLERDVPVAEYYYSSGRLDSIFYHYSDYLLDLLKNKPYHYQSMNTVTPVCRKFLYDGAGNITREYRSKYYTQQLNEEGDTACFCIDYEYDSSPNPFYYLFKQTGVLLTDVNELNFSKNNPVKQTESRVDAEDTYGGQDPDWSYTHYYEYTYNVNGFPKLIFLIAPGTSNTKILYIDYI